ncbi:hypothetical protein HDE_06818 [Halotydeus destructor]|nr:hypothetical protein HDE_06818 [Halotydeus destructor]
MMHLSVRLGKNLLVPILQQEEAVSNVTYAILYSSCLLAKVFLNRNICQLEEVLFRLHEQVSRQRRYLQATRNLCRYWLLASLIIGALAIKCNVADFTLEEALQAFYGVHASNTSSPFYHYFAYADAALLPWAFTWHIFALVSYLIMATIVHSMKRIFIDHMVKEWTTLKQPDVESASYQWKLLVMSERKVNCIYSPILLALIGWLFAFFTMIFVTYRKSIELQHASIWSELIEILFPAMHFMTLLVVITVNHRYNCEIKSRVKSLQVCQSFSVEDDPLDELKENLVTDIVENYERIIRVFSLCNINFGFVFSMINAMIPLAIIILELWTDTKLA